ncbi:MAG: 1-deoxy-D-xylulose-5-phosphate synthase [Ruminococcaceae bacterium]|nr:1-deoxy-D-xylulose-5-phosphate synthase [Oscillospiraceae bacterium]
MINFSGCNQPFSDLDKLTIPELETLCCEIREFLVKSVSKTGGHLASNLGVVELTVALHRVFDFPTDKIVWDVGHQSYVHKILSGRASQFDTLRQFGGLSGFPKTAESPYDCFNTGHSSTSVSAALGLARSRDLNKEHHQVIAVFGDGAMTGGMLFEALNDAGHSKTPLILILNDNAMSISKNVGAVPRYLRNLRAKPGYFKSKHVVETFLQKIPAIGTPTANLIRKGKRAIKRIVLPLTMFQELGFEYLGPIDGHSMEKLIFALERAKETKRPTVVHVHTKKGKGYLPAEYNPQVFHGVSGFDLEHLEDSAPKEDDYSAVAGNTLLSLAKEDKSLVAITAAMPGGTGLLKFAHTFRDRFFDVGIAEQHAVTLSAGMAAGGIKPVFAVYSSFLQRAYDQILHDICLQNLHAVFCVDRAGVVGADGETHHGLFDIAYLSAMPNMSILSPSSFRELEQMLRYAILEHDAPIAIRYPRGSDQIEVPDFVFGKAHCLQEGQNITIVSCGRMLKVAKAAAELLAEEGITAEMMSVPTLCPLDGEALLQSVKKTGKMAVLEDHSIDGGLGSMVASLLAEAKSEAGLLRLAYPKEPIVHGKVSELDARYGLDAEGVCRRIKEFLHE